MEKAQKNHLKVDYIGGVRSLTKADKQAISDFINQHKLSSKKALLSTRVIKTKQLKTKK